jgi:hypothetical protein
MPNAQYRVLAATANDDADHDHDAAVYREVLRLRALERTPDDIASTGTQVPRVSCGGLGKCAPKSIAIEFLPIIKRGTYEWR